MNPEFHAPIVFHWVRLLGFNLDPYIDICKNVVHWDGLRREPLAPTVGFLEVIDMGNTFVSVFRNDASSFG